MNVKIFGERNTGTNYLSKLVQSNFDCKLLNSSALKIPFLNSFEIYKNLYFKLTDNTNLGWKHAKPDLQKIENYISRNENTVIIFVVKNPYSFLLSLHKRPYHNSKLKKATFNEFLKNKWKTQKRENVLSDYPNPIEMWNDKMEKYIEINNRFPNNTLIVLYEDLLRSPSNIILNLADKFNLKMKNNEFLNFNSSTKNDNKSFDDYSNYYLNEEWKKKLDNESVEIIREKIDQKILEKFKYNLL